MKSFPNKLFLDNIKLVLILAVASILRLYNLSDIPYGFHFDEAQAAYNGFLISEHLKNVNGEFLPLDIDYFGDFRPALHSYLIVPFIKILGNTIVAARLPAAIFGVYSVLITYLLTLKIFKSKSISHIAASFLAVSPFHIIFSRASSDAIIEMSFVLTSIYFLYCYIENKNIIKLPIIYLLWVASFFTYQISRMMIPIITMVFLITQSFGGIKLIIKSRTIIILIPLIIFIIFPLFYFLTTNKTAGRFSQVSTFSFPEVQRALNEQVTEAGTIGLNPVFVRIFHNKIVAYSSDILKRHLSFYSPQILLFDDARPIRYQISNIGFITPFEYLFALVGIYFFVRKKIKQLIFVTLVIIIAPLPSAITFEDFPNFHRAIYLIPYVQILAALGLYMIFMNIKFHKAFTFIGVGIFAWYSCFFILQYFILSPLHEPFHRNYENKEISKYLDQNKNIYDRVGLTGETGIYISYLYFNELDVLEIPINKEGKYFNGEYNIENVYFTKYRCVDTISTIYNRFDLVINLNECEPSRIFIKDKDFRLSDGSLAASAYIIDKAKSEQYKKRNIDLFNCLESRGFKSKTECLRLYPESRQDAI